MKLLLLIIILIDLIFTSTQSTFGQVDSTINVDSVSFRYFLADAKNQHKDNKNPDSFQFNKIKSQLNFKFDSILKRYNLTSSKYSISVYSLNSKSYIIEKNPDLFVKPASVTKLLTAYTVFEMFSDTFNFRTTLYTEDSDLSDGIINGNVFIRGVGDPKISLADLDNIVQQFINLGIKRIDGKIIADGTLYDNIRNRFAYSGDADEVEPVAPISALSLEKNRIKILVNTHIQGTIPKIQVIPNSDHFNVSNNLKIGILSKKGKRKARSRLSAHSKLNEQGNQTIFLNGELAKNSSFGVEDFNLNPDLTFASVFRNRLISNNIKVIGNYETVKKNVKISYEKLKPFAELIRPISSVVTEMNKNSDNYLAENLFKLVGAHFNNDSVTSNSSKKFIDNKIKELSEDTDHLKNTKNNLKVNDGSGLSRRNMFSSRFVCEILRDISFKAYFSSFYKTLAVCGFDGTLSKRLKNTNAQMNLAGKTGTHRDVSGLAGFVRDHDGEIYVFSFLFNGPSVGTYKMIENELGLVLSDFSVSNQSSIQNPQ